MIYDVRHLNYFMFSQNSLNTFSECPLKFKKRYIDNLKWNNLPSQSIREIIELGRDFHLIAQRYFSKIISETEELEGELGICYRNLVEHFPLKNDYIYLPEYKLRMVSDDMRLEANYDLIIITEENKIQIWDWKTHYNHIKKIKSGSIQEKFSNTYQTMVYMFVLKEQLEMITGNKTGFEDISMTYWCPNPAQAICTIPYSQQLHERNKEKLKSTIQKILSYDYKDFNPASYVLHCKRCEFNLLCNKTKPDFNSADNLIQLINELDLDHIEEIF